MSPNSAFDFGHDWTLPYHYDHTRKWLDDPGQYTLEDNLELQDDEFSNMMASLLLRMLKQVSDPEPRTSEASVLLQGWSHRVATGLAMSLITGYWVCAFTHGLLQPRIGTQSLTSG